MLYANDSEDGTFYACDADEPQEAAEEYAWGYGIEEGDSVYVVRATERLPEEGDDLDADAECALDVTHRWRFRVVSCRNDGVDLEEVIDAR
jgi:hypothetical protein